MDVPITGLLNALDTASCFVTSNLAVCHDMLDSCARVPAPVDIRCS